MAFFSHWFHILLFCWFFVINLLWIHYVLCMLFFCSFAFDTVVDRWRYFAWIFSLFHVQVFLFISFIHWNCIYYSCLFHLFEWSFVNVVHLLCKQWCACQIIRFIEWPHLHTQCFYSSKWLHQRDSHFKRVHKSGTCQLFNDVRCMVSIWFWGEKKNQIQFSDIFYLELHNIIVVFFL